MALHDCTTSFCFVWFFAWQFFKTGHIPERFASWPYHSSDPLRNKHPDFAKDVEFLSFIGLSVNMFPIIHICYRNNVRIHTIGTGEPSNNLAEKQVVILRFVELAKHKVDVLGWWRDVGNKMVVHPICGTTEPLYKSNSATSLFIWIMVKAGNDDLHFKRLRLHKIVIQQLKGMKAKCDARHWNAGFVFCKFNRKKRTR